MSLAGPGHGTRRAEPLRFPMLKVIARDFIKPEHVAAVLPLCRELVARTRLEEHIASPTTFSSTRKTRPFHLHRGVARSCSPRRPLPHRTFQAAGAADRCTSAPAGYLYSDGLLRGLSEVFPIRVDSPPLHDKNKRRTKCWTSIMSGHRLLRSTEGNRHARRLF